MPAGEVYLTGIKTSYCSLKRWYVIFKQRHNLDRCSAVPVFYDGPCTKLEQCLQAKLYKDSCMHH